jgi:hypothetical protein
VSQRISLTEAIKLAELNDMPANYLLGVLIAHAQCMSRADSWDRIARVEAATVLAIEQELDRMAAA